MADWPDSAQPEPRLDVARHLKYWKMCYKGPLPRHYLPTESNRMALAYFMLTSIDILTPPVVSDSTQAAGDAPQQQKAQAQPVITPEDRPRLREWVLAHQHPTGGFCGSPSMIFPANGAPASRDADGDADTAFEKFGHPQLPATVFALQLLALLADEGDAEAAYAGVDRARILRWLRRLQRADGSFGEMLMELPGRGWFVGGGYDMRYCYLATMARWMLRGDVKEGDPAWVEDFDTKALVQYILDAQTYDGGLAQSSSYEPHAGYAYCAISALSLLDRPLEGGSATHHSKILHSGIRSIPTLAHWLASRQFVYREDKGEDADDESAAEQDSHTASPLDGQPEETLYVGFNGRCNKVADSCYCWWTCGALAILGEAGLIRRGPARRFLLDQMQHTIGGFGKHPGSPPDMYHSFFGLAGLAVMAGQEGEPGLKEFDSSLAVTAETARKMERARAGLLKQVGQREGGEGEGKGEGKGRAAGSSLEGELLEMAFDVHGGKPAWLATTQA